MLIVRDTPESMKGVWFDFKLRGEEVKLKIRPITSEIHDKITKKHTKVVIKKDPDTRALVKVDDPDKDAITDELIDHILEDFEGFGIDKDTPLELNLKNKKKVANIPPVSDSEISIADFIFEKARELAAVSEKEFEELEKNS